MVVNVGKYIDECFADNEYLRGDDCRSTRSYLRGWIGSLYRRGEGIPMSMNDEIEVNRRIDLFVREKR